MKLEVESWNSLRFRTIVGVQNKRNSTMDEGDFLSDHQLHAFNRDENLHKELQLLAGILKGILADQVLQNEELDFLDLWLKQSHLSDFGDGQDLLCHLQDICGSENLTSEQVADTIELFSDVAHSLSRRATRAKDFENQFLGLLKGALSDRTAQDQEITDIYEFLSQQPQLGAQEEEMRDLLERVLADGVVTDEERAHAQKAMEKMCGHTFHQDGSTDSVPRVLDSSLIGLEYDYTNLTFVVTGEPKTRSKKDVQNELKALGIQVKEHVSSLVDVLVVGNSDHYRTVNAGNKQRKAEKLRKEGHRIKVVDVEALDEWLLIGRSVKQ